MQAKHSSHIVMVITGCLAVQRGFMDVLLGTASSVQMSPHSSDIFTNSTAHIFLTTFGGREAAGPAAWRFSNSERAVSASVGCLWPVGPAVVVAAAARRFRSEEPVEPSAGVNCRSCSSPHGGYDSQGRV